MIALLTTRVFFRSITFVLDAEQQLLLIKQGFVTTTIALHRVASVRSVELGLTIAFRDGTHQHITPVGWTHAAAARIALRLCDGIESVQVPDLPATTPTPTLRLAGPSP